MTVKKAVTAWCAVITAVALWGCEEPNGGDTCPAPSNGALELRTALDGKTYTVNQQVTVEFSADKSKVTGVLLKISIDGGVSFKSILSSGSVLLDQAGEQVQCLSHTWTIGQEGEAVGYAASNTDCVLKIEDYQNNTLSDVSGTFTINQ